MLPQIAQISIKTVTLCLIVGISASLYAKEGMHIPATLKNKEADMKSMGLEIPIEQLYNNDGTGLNNAVVLFGKGCTGEIISSKGLVLTNHHCGYGTVQGLSNMQNDYFAHGYWAQNMQEEIPCAGLTVTFIRRMENITDRILNNIPDTLNDIDRQEIISARIKSLENGYKYTSGMDVTIRPYYNGNQYWAIMSETYKDIRLVAFPPNGIGTFGGDAENWMWPRHTGDFSLFRVYAGANNKPAAYSKTNKPYQAHDFFTINAAGYKEGDFAMVYGFPAYTNEYISSAQLNQVLNIEDPIRIAVRTQKLDIWNKNMEQSRDVFLKYTSKRAGIANGWKKWQGEVLGLKNNDVLNKKISYEQEFQAWATKQDSAYPHATALLPQLQAAVTATDSLVKAEEYIREAVYGIELIQQGAILQKMLLCFRAGISGQPLTDTLDKLTESAHGFYRNYDAATDKQVFARLMPMFFNNCASWVPNYYTIAYQQHNNNFTQWANAVYNTSMIADENTLKSFASDATPADSNRLMSDPAWQLYHSISVAYDSHILPSLMKSYSRVNYLNRLYMKCQMSERADKDLYPDANFTLRLSYGKVKGIDPEGPAPYSYQTNLNEVIALDDPNSYEFQVPQKLKDLYNKKNYGRWAVNGTVPVAFITDNHTSGGNSGSPVLNGKGQLIGTNFDRVWEGTMSDYYFDPKVCRNITLDIRYTLFLIEKFGNAGWLLKEMKIVKK